MPGAWDVELKEVKGKKTIKDTVDFVVAASHFSAVLMRGSQMPSPPFLE